LNLREEVNLSAKDTNNWICIVQSSFATWCIQYWCI